MTRSELREHCFKMLFCTEFHNNEDIDEQINRYFEIPDEEEWDENKMTEILHQINLKEKDCDYLRQKVCAVLGAMKDLDAKINSVALGWKTGRMGKVELTILRLALYEMLYEEDVPEKVAVNEAVELSKKFGGKDSPAFVNGILAKLI